MYSYFIFTIERLRFRARLIFVSKKIFLTKRARSRTDARFAGTRISTPRVRTYSETCDDDTTKAPRSSRSRDTHVQSIEDCQARREAESYFFATRKYDSTFSFFREERREDRDDDGRKRNVHKRRERNLPIDLAFEDDVETAELIAKNFESMGIQTPRELRKIVVKQNVKLILFEAVAIMFNLGVTVAIYSIFLLNGAPLAWEPGASELVSQVLAFALFICAGIFSVETIAHAVVFFSFVYSLFYFSFANLDKFTSAMHRLAEEAANQPDLSSFRSIRRAVSATRVLQKLNEVKRAIIVDKKLADETLKDMPELKRLSAYFELKNAIDEHGFSYTKYGLTEERAMVLASMFAEVDEDADGEINEEELRKLLTEMAKNEHVEWTSLNADFNVAFNLLDTDGDGKIDLDNFCEWLSEPEKAKKEESKVSPR